MDLQPFTAEKARALRRCEKIIQRGMGTFVAVGAALAEIRDGGLYKRDYTTFKAYCKATWGFDENYARKQIRASEVVAALQSGTIVPLLPATESQARPLTTLETEKVGEVWQCVIERAPVDKKGVSVITAEHVEETRDWYLAGQPDDEEGDDDALDDEWVCTICNGSDFDENGDCLGCADEPEGDDEDEEEAEEDGEDEPTQTADPLWAAVQVASQAVRKPFQAWAAGKAEAVIRAAASNLAEEWIA